MEKQFNVLYIVNIPAPYMVNYFNELGKFCNLTVIFEKNSSTERDESWKKYKFFNFNGIILKGIETAVDMAFCPQIIKYLKRNTYDFIFISSMATPTGIVAIEYLKWRKIPYYLESEGGFAKDGKGLKERFKKHLMSKAKYYFSTTQIGDDYFLTYGATRDKLVKYPFTSIYEKDILTDIISDTEKTSLRNELGMTEEKIVITVGQFIYRKGFDILLRACKNLQGNVGIYFVGGNPTPEYIDLKEKLGLDSVHFIGFKTKEELSRYYKAADVFVLPTREDIWGLVINEAMAYGLPVITTDRCIAGMELVDNGENGYIVPVEAVDDLKQAIEYTITDEESRKKMGRTSLNKIDWYTFESMAKVHMEFMRRHSH